MWPYFFPPSKTGLLRGSLSFPQGAAFYWFTISTALPILDTDSANPISGRQFPVTTTLRDAQVTGPRTCDGHEKGYELTTGQPHRYLYLTTKSLYLHGIQILVLH